MNKQFLEKNANLIFYLFISSIIVIGAISLFQKRVDEIKSINQATLKILEKYSNNITDIDTKIQDLKTSTEANRDRIYKLEEHVMKYENITIPNQQITQQQIISILDKSKLEIRKEIIVFKDQVNHKIDELSKRITIIENKNKTAVKPLLPQRS